MITDTRQLPTPIGGVRDGDLWVGPCEVVAVCVWVCGEWVGATRCAIDGCAHGIAPPSAEVLSDGTPHAREHARHARLLRWASRFAAAAAAAGESARVAHSRLHRLDGCGCGRFAAHPCRPDELHAVPAELPKELLHSPASCNQRVALRLLEVLKPLRAALLALSGL